MATKLSTMSRVDWNSLDPDLLVIVAKHCDGKSVCRLSAASACEESCLGAGERPEELL